MSTRIGRANFKINFFLTIFSVTMLLNFDNLTMGAKMMKLLVTAHTMTIMSFTLLRSDYFYFDSIPHMVVKRLHIKTNWVYHSSESLKNLISQKRAQKRVMSVRIVNEKLFYKDTLCRVSAPFAISNNKMKFSTPLERRRVRLLKSKQKLLQHV